METFRPERYSATRSLALYSTAIVLANAEALVVAQHVCRHNNATSRQIYEVMLQSYLFLGFPRMLTAAEQLAKDGISSDLVSRNHRVTAADFQDWTERGEQLCRRVYDCNYETLKARVEAMAPEVFLWMELEGYGKVLSRPGLHVIDREMAIVACLMIEHRPAQLHSHIRGAINVGAPRELLCDVVSDLRTVATKGFRSACGIMEKLGIAA
ncbi:MAG: carboxymuconolactone decarboxylase family protein [candidate division Zixibacteria bacterium]|nr:carboxymuconolactone decarboxylase family protein [candidate division Zixibacteria bacterium]